MCVYLVLIGIRLRFADVALDIEKSNVVNLVENNIKHQRAVYRPTFKLPRSYGNVVSKRRCVNKHQWCWHPKWWKQDEAKLYEQFWNTQRAVFPETVFVDRPIVHFRCGDGPHNGKWKKGRTLYALPCVEDTARLMRYANVTHAWMIVGGHGGHQRECDALAQRYARKLPGVTLLDRASAETDFMWLKSAPKVVAVIMSSFTFASRLGKLDTLFMPNMRADLFNSPWAPLNFEPCPEYYG